MESFINIKTIEIDDDSLYKLNFLCDQFLNHSFDILGSGPVNVKYGVDTVGFAGNRYKNKTVAVDSYENSQWLLQIMHPLDVISSVLKGKRIDSDYTPIDWHIDFRSGFRFCQKKYNSMEKCLAVIGKKKGVDIKVPWELGRFYHLPQMALLGIFDKDRRKTVLTEFKNEIYDFIAVNPYKKSVQWSAVMDVSIRAVNLLLAFDIMKQYDSENILSGNFEQVFEDFIKSHGKLIIKNLEYGPCNSNHYLSNLVGLVYIASYLRAEPETDAWLVFSTQELIAEVKKQFYEEGSNFEGSTSYHRLSLEFVIYATALILGVVQTDRKKAFETYEDRRLERLNPRRRQQYDLKEDSFFPAWYMERIFRAAQFTYAVTNPLGEIMQVGDNDSGRLLKLSPVGAIIDGWKAREKYKNLKSEIKGPYFEERILNHSSILSAAAGIAGERALYTECMLPMEYTLIRTMIKNIKCKQDTFSAIGAFDKYEVPYCDLTFKKKTVFSFESRNRAALNANLKFIYYKKFGLCIFKSDRLFLGAVIDTAKNTKLYGHTHNDKLSVDIIVDKKAVVRDPGTFIYTALPKVRDRFRSVSSHSTILVGNSEQNDFNETFNLVSRAKGYLINQSGSEIELYAEYKGVKHSRKIEILEDAIVITDRCNKEFEVNFNQKRFSNGYGQILRQ